METDGGLMASQTEAVDVVSPENEGAASHRGGSRLAMRVGAVVVPALVLLAIYFVVASQSNATVHQYVVPPGTGARIDAGERVELIPAEARIRVGDELMVVNQDDRDHVLGPFSVRAGETLRHVFDRPGVYEGLCTVHSGNRVQIIVS